MPQDWEPADWAEQQAHRVAREIRRLRAGRSAQWLSDQTEELGYRINRSVIADLENGRRRYVTSVELTMFALALETAPMALLFPGPDYREKIDVMPKLGPVPEIWGVQWFAGRVEGESFLPFIAGWDDSPVNAPDPEQYDHNVRYLRRGYQILELDERRRRKREELALLLQQRRRGDDVDGEISLAQEEIDYLEGRIAKLGDSVVRFAVPLEEVDFLDGRIAKELGAESKADDGR